MIIHGANAMGGSSDPDGERGFGRVHLEAAMPFDGEDLWALYVEDDDGSTSGKGQVWVGALMGWVFPWLVGSNYKYIHILVRFRVRLKHAHREIAIFVAKSDCYVFQCGKPLVRGPARHMFRPYVDLTMIG